MSRIVKISHTETILNELMIYQKLPEWSNLLSLVELNCQDPITDINMLCKLGRQLMYYTVVFSQKDTERYFDFDKALLRLNNKTLMLKITELGVYCIFSTMFSLRTFIKSIYEYINKTIVMYMDLEDDSTFTPQQIIKSDHPQKPVFYVTFDNINDVQELKSHCFEYFGKEAIIEKSGEKYMVTIDLTMENLDMVELAVTNFKEHLAPLKKYSSERIENINQVMIIPPSRGISQGGKSYVGYNVSQDNWRDEKEEFKLSVLKCIPELFDSNTPTIIINHGNIFQGNNTNNINSGKITINTNNTKELKNDNMKKWVNSNKPEDGERSKLYYDKYKRSLNGAKPIDQKIFCEYVESLRYVRSVYDSYTRWKKVN